MNVEQGTRINVEQGTRIEDLRTEKALQKSTFLVRHSSIITFIVKDKLVRMPKQ